MRARSRGLHQVVDIDVWPEISICTERSEGSLEEITFVSKLPALLFLLTALLASAIAFSAEAEESDAVPPPDVEIWLGEKVGRYGDMEFKIHGGTAEHPTPKGVFRITWKDPMHWSKQWDAWMPFAMFFSEGAALHEGDVSGPSHGCVRVDPDAAQYLYKVTRVGVTRVIVYP
jgi:hypothetical protein